MTLYCESSLVPPTKIIVDKRTLTCLVVDPYKSYLVTVDECFFINLGRGVFHFDRH